MKDNSVSNSLFKINFPYYILGLGSSKPSKVYCEKIKIFFFFVLNHVVLKGRGLVIQVRPQGVLGVLSPVD
jgi:hypothetical protein